MLELAHRTLWEVVSEQARRAEKREAAVAYVTRATEVRFERGDRLVVDASDIAIQNGLTKASVLRAAYRRGARLFSRSGLHAKLLVLDSIAVVGSSNLSATSVQKKIEAALLTDDATVVAMARAFLDELCRESHPIDDAFLRRIEAIKVKKRMAESDKSDRHRGPDSPRARKASRAIGTSRIVLRSPNKPDVEPDYPRSISLKNKNIALTGWFEYGRRDGERFGRQQAVIDACKAAGGNASQQMVTGDTDILLIGKWGHEGYANGTYGRKTETAARLRHKPGGRPQIILEEWWVRLMAPRR